MDNAMIFLALLEEHTLLYVVTLLFVKVTVLLTTAWCVHALLHRANPRWRVLLWRSTSLGVLLLIILAACPSFFAIGALPHRDTIPEAVPGPVIETAVVDPIATPEPPSNAAHQEVPIADSVAEPFPPITIPAIPQEHRTAQTPSVELPETVDASVVDQSNEPGEIPAHEQASAPSVAIAGAPASGRDLSMTIVHVLGVIWVCGIFLLTLRTLMSWRRLRAIIKRAQPAPQWAEEQTDRMKEALDCKQRIAVRVTSEIGSPCLVGLWRPLILLPEEMQLGETPAVLIHEISHVKTRDIAWNWSLCVMGILAWMHPLVWRIRSAHANACDRVADSVAASRLGDASRYISILAKLAIQKHASTPGGAVAMAGPSCIQSRIRALQRKLFSAGLPRGRMLSAVAFGVFMVAILGGLALTRIKAEPGENVSQNDRPLSALALADEPSLGGEENASGPALSVLDSPTSVDPATFPAAIIPEAAVESRPTFPAAVSPQAAVESRPSLDSTNQMELSISSLLSQGKLDEALAVYHELPTPVRVTRLGQALQRAGRGDEMVKFYQDFLVNSPVARDGMYDSVPGSLGTASEVISHIGRVQRTAETANFVTEHLESHPEKEWLYPRAILLRLKVGQVEEAMEDFQHYEELQESLSALWYGWFAEQCAQRGMVDEAIVYYERAVEAPISNEDLRAIANTYAAVIGYGNLRASRRAGYFYRLGELYRQKEQWVEVERCYESLLDIEPTTDLHENAELALTQLWLTQGKSNRIIEQVRKDLENDQSNAELHDRLAKLLLGVGETQEGFAHYRQAADLTPDDLQRRLAWAKALADAERDIEAIEAYAIAMTTSIRHPEQRPRFASRSYASPELILIQLEQKYGASITYGSGNPFGSTYPRPISYETSQPGTGYSNSTPRSPTIIAPRVELHEALLKLYRDALTDEQANHSERAHGKMIEQVTSLLASQGDDEGVVMLLLDHRKRTTFAVRNRIAAHLGNIKSLDNVIAKLTQQIENDSTDGQGRLILGDLLRAAGRGDEAIEVYDSLSENGQCHEELASTFEQMGDQARAVREHESALGTKEIGTREHTRILTTLAWIHLRASENEKSIEYFRQALQDETVNTRPLLEGLRQAGGNVEEFAPQPDPLPTDPIELLRMQAEAFKAEGKHEEAIAACEQILARHTTDVQTMALLGRTQLDAGLEDQALATFERAYGLRHMVSTDYGVDSDLRRLYEKRGETDKLIEFYTERHHYIEVGLLYSRLEQLEKYETYLREQIEKTPDIVELRLFLVDYYLGNSFLGNYDINVSRFDKARDILEELREESKTNGYIRPQSLASYYERLGDPATALELLEPIDYTREHELDDWLGVILMRLYSKTDQLPEALEICRLRLRKGPSDRRTVEIAEEIVEQAIAIEGGRLLLEEFLVDMDNTISGRTASRFKGAVLASLRSVSDMETSATQDAIQLLTQGRIVSTPSTNGSLLDFLDNLASESETTVVQSFRSSASRIPAPKFERIEAPAYELLAQSLNGLPVSFSITQDGYWSIVGGGPAPFDVMTENNPERKSAIAASGGAILALNQYNVFRPTEGNLISCGRLFFDPVLTPNVVGFIHHPEVVQAVDNLGRDVTMPLEEGSLYNIQERYTLAGVTFYLRNHTPPADSIATLKLKVNVAVCTRWAVLESETLDADRPTVIEHEDVTITIQPLETELVDERERYILAVAIKIKDHPPLPNYDALNLEYVAGSKIESLAPDGTRTRLGGCSGGGSPFGYECKFRLNPENFDPINTCLRIPVPVDVEFVPMEFEFQDVQIRDAD
jgi:tetratricopeptide (TPR) repeat protein/beta-lactamase regulating signal transducer with metallopeptidase domain